MKNIISLTLAITMSFLGINETHAQKWGSKVKGNGNVTTKTVNTSDYEIIDVIGFMDVILEKGTEGAIQVTTDDNLHEYVIVESNGNTLKIKIKDRVNIRYSKELKIVVPFKDISEVNLVGSGDVISKDTIKTEAFEATVTGSGDMILDVQAMTLDAKVTGSGDLELKGSANDLEVKVSGSGDFDGAKMKAENAQAYVSGSGDAEIYAKESIKARVNGSGGVRYGGNPPSSDTKVMGSGSIKSM